MSTQFYPMTFLQLMIGSRLARGFDHRWGRQRKALLRHFAGHQQIYLEEVMRVVRELDPEASQGEPGTGTWPTINQQGCLVHDSRTGRLGWSISPDGEIALQIFRNNQAVLEALIFHTPEGYQIEHVEVHLAQDPELMVRNRHWKALGHAVFLLLGHAGIERIRPRWPTLAAAMTRIEKDMHTRRQGVPTHDQH